LGLDLYCMDLKKINKLNLFLHMWFLLCCFDFDLPIIKVAVLACKVYIAISNTSTPSVFNKRLEIFLYFVHWLSPFFHLSWCFWAQYVLRDYLLLLILFFKLHFTCRQVHSGKGPVNIECAVLSGFFKSRPILVTSFNICTSYYRGH